MSADEAVAPLRISGSTSLVGVIGWPVAGSLSPTIHNAAFRALGLDWVYVPLAVPPGALAEAVAGLRALGFAGANVTMPHKADAAAALQDLSEDAARLGAVNTIVIGPEDSSGHNTDVTGFEGFLRDDVGFDPRGRSALLFGAGGAARACALALTRSGISRLVVAARDPERARDLGRAIDDLGPIEVVPWDRAPGVRADLIVNATPVGADREGLPAPELRDATAVVDLLYRPATTPLLARARGAGVAAFGGLGLLLRQGALSFELWTGQVPPMDVMSAAAVASVAETPADVASEVQDRPTA
ncbi:MAG TPA: shikimate dehydrogenase [Actinomycetota bacterium]|nr:shikimate dehydrogenase [Actinomycetota bacterium]